MNYYSLVNKCLGLSNKEDSLGWNLGFGEGYSLALRLEAPYQVKCSTISRPGNRALSPTRPAVASLFFWAEL
jgi:hypothetical protein